ncbi:MAG: CvpA family protein [Alphaproteobacteria bacterium]|nr:CvpA family protein [Alphaproteobacteria bacterium]MDA8004203.1 CvpA family protein [Alphaproteobacteria bacterium]MDA8006192.1 CvpA family protein [Alphaproteobacteria bacterium]MDA8013552.1 CvpA family protein [Alphaproteobacteria bacterium]
MTIPDLVVLGLLLSTSLLGLSRGLVRTILNLVAWVVAIGFTLTIRDAANEYFAPYFDSRITTDIVSLTVPFIVLLVFLQFLFGFLVRGVHRLLPPQIDHGLGLLFGFLFGVVVLAILWIVIEDFASDLLESEVAQRSRTLPYVARSAEPVRGWLERVLPEALSLPEGEAETVTVAEEQAVFVSQALGVVSRARAATRAGGLSSEELAALLEDLTVLSERFGESGDEQVAGLLLLELRGTDVSGGEGDGGAVGEVRRLLDVLRGDVEALQSP